MASIIKKRIFGILKFHQSQGAAYGRRECAVCLTEYPCATVQIAKGILVWDFELERFVTAEREREMAREKKA